VNQEAAQSEIARLEANGAAEPGAPGFAALAEAHRRSGAAQRAIEVARDGLRHQPELAAGRVALALALLDQERIEEARTELARVLDAIPDHPPAVAALESSGERSAESTGEQPPQRVDTPAEASLGALGAIEEVELEEAFASAEAERDQMIDANHLAEAALRSVDDVADPLSAESPLATETVASLLEEQGHAGEAEAMRQAIELREDVGPEPKQSEDRVIATLERWLDNLRRVAR